jgi:hypothetical protein
MYNANFKLDCAFLHQPNVLNLLSPVMLQIYQQRIAQVHRTYQDALRETFTNSILTDAVLTILRANKVPSLELKMLKGLTLAEGELVWIEQDFNFKGTIKAREALNGGQRSAYAKFSATIKRYDNIVIKGEFNARHLFGDTSVSTLTGKKTVFMFAYIKEVSEKEIILRPVFIGSRMIGTNSGFDLGIQSLQLSIEDIDEFKKTKTVGRTHLNIDRNKDWSEDQVKRWFAEIIFENHVPKDWGGEKSDLFTNHIHVQGQRFNAAFLFKGPARFETMTVKNLGKNGDQISRLFDEPADIFILHHCHRVTAEIIKTMGAFASNYQKLSKFCIIDGEDTIRVLKAYKKI